MKRSSRPIMAAYLAVAVATGVAVWARAGVTQDGPGATPSGMPGMSPTASPSAMPTACPTSEPTAGPTSAPTASPSAGPGSSAANPASGCVEVTIQPGAAGKGAQAYGENPLWIKPGTMVIWINNDSMPHTATADGGEFDSGTLSPGQTYAHTFSDNTSADYTYYCRVHGKQSMSGDIRVVGSGASPTPSPSSSTPSMPGTSGGGGGGY